VGAVSATFALASPAHAQYGGGMMPGGGMGAPPGGGPKKEEKEGPAEQAPETAKDKADLEPVGGYAYQEKRRTQLLEVDGYFRARTDYMSNFFLSQGYAGASASDPTNTKPGLPPFPVPIDCPRPTMAISSGTEPAAGNCSSKAMGGANLRLRLEPTLNVSDQVRVHAQVDILDNTIMGSTPDSLAGLNRPWGQTAGLAPSQIFSTTQSPPEVGLNGYFSSIRAKRAWGEVDTEYGSLRFGRMPWHFGRGIAFNDGGCMDCDGGTTVDRVMGLSEIYGHQIGLAWDWAGKGFTSSQSDLGQLNSNGYPIDYSQKDDVFQAMAVITKIDPPVQLRERLDRGEVVTSYGLQLVYRSQESAVVNDSGQACGATNMGATINASGVCPSPNAATGTTATVNTPDQVATLDPIHARLIQPNLWFKLQYRALTVEFEGTAVIGHMDHGGALAESPGEPLSIRQWAGVLASDLRLYHDAFYLGLEVGAASGDQAEDKSQYLNVAWRSVKQPSGDHYIRDFRFSPDYHIDQIFFRQIMGTVTNAVYIRPAASYWLDLLQGRQIGFSGSVVYSMAQVPVATPGNALTYGLETNVGINYRNTQEGFFAGFVWGVFWPFGALNRTNPDIWPIGSISEGARDAKAAQIVRANLGIRF
jgi:uncharacterized protein (TIGR04551 family)